MKLRLPNRLIAALLSAMSATVFTTLSTGSAAYGSTTYDDLTKSDYFEANENVYNTGKGTFYLKTESCALNLTLTLNLNALAAYQGVHDYANAGYYGSFVTWTYNNNAGATYGMADVSSGYSSADYSGVTGMWNGSPWTTNNKITTTTLWNYADADGNVTLTINNDPTNTTRNVVVTAANGDTLYSADGLRSGNYVSQHITSFTVNMNYVTSVTLNSNSILDSSDFTAPKDYTEAFVKTQEESVGRIVFLGDSITHGVQDMSWRWGLFKTMVDNGIEYEIAGPLSGYHSDPLNGDYNGDFSSSQYGGATFDNAHYAQSSGRTHNMLTASNSGNSLGGSTGVNYGGVTSAKVGNEYNGDTYIMMMGTNDILSDGANTVEKMATVTNRLLGEGSLANGTWTNAGVEGPLVGLSNDNAAYRGEWGTMGKIIDNMKMGENDIMYVMPVPTWGVGRTGLHVYADLVPAYNEKLEAWTKAYSSSHTGTVKFVDINRGLVDKTLNGRYLAPDAFFRTTGGDYIHPNEQGALIIAGNLAQGMGLAGRTAGLHRADSHTANTEWMSGAASYTINAGQSVTIGAGELDMNGGYTVDFSALYGNGATNGWLDKSNALSISVGDGSNVGTLKLSEGYISWGDKLLFCQDNSVRGNDNIRITYHTGDTANQVGNGYYVWLGDMLIGQALNGSNGTLSGITLSSVGATGTVSGLTYSNSAYAPTSHGTASAENAFYATITKVMTSHDSTPIAGPTDFSQATTVGKTGNAVYGAASNEGGDVVATYGNAISGSGSWFAGQGVSGVEHTGNISLQVTEGASGAGMFGVVNTGTANGNVTVQVDGASLSSYTGGAASIIGAYAGNISGKFTAVMNSGTLSGGILGGFENAAAGNSIGSVDLIVNGGTVGGAILGGSKVANGTVNGTIGISVAGGTVNGRDGVAIIGSGTAGTVNGDIDITISGGVIKGDIIGKQTTGVTYGEDVDATVTVQGNKASITGNITADTVKLRNVAATDYSDGFDKYAGTITATNLVLDNYTAGLVNATLVTDYVTVSNGTNAIIRGLHLRNCSIDADEASTLTLGGTIESGNTITYTGNLYLEDGTTFNFSNTDSFTAAEGAEGISAGQYIYKVKADSEGHLYSVDGSALTSAHTSTFTGAGVVAGKSFFYDNTTNALIAYGSDATYNIATSTVNYSDIDGVGSVTMSGGQLNLDTALKSGVSVTATGGTVNLGNGVNLAASSLSFAEAESLAINSNGGTGALQLSGNQTAAASILAKATGDGNVTLTGNTTFAGGLTTALTGTLTIGSGQLNIGGGKGQHVNISSFNSIVLSAGTKVRYEENGNKTLNNISLAGNAEFWMYDTNGTGNPVTFAGETNIGSHTLSLTNTWKSTINIQHLVGKGTLSVVAPDNQWNDRLNLNVLSLADYTGNLALTSQTSEATINVYTGTKDVHMGTISTAGTGGRNTVLNLLGNHQLTVSGLSGNGTNVTINASEMPLAIDLNGNYTYGSTLNAGKLVVTGSGTQTLNGTSTLNSVEIGNGATLALGGTTTLKGMVTNAGSLVLNGNVAVNTSDLANFEFKTPGSGNYTGQGIYEGSGYLSNAEVYLVKSNGGSVSGTGSFTGVTATHDDNGNYTFAVSDDATYHINSALTYNDTEMGNATTLYIAKGGSLTNGDAASKAKALSGTGTFVINSTLNNTNTGETLPANFSMGDSWNGIVQVKGGTMQIGTTINNLTQGDSWVELKGVAGYLGGNNTYAGNIILTNNGETPAMTINSSVSNNTTVLAGKITGDGDIYRTIGNGNTLSFTGDISGWTGTYYNGGNNGFNSGWNTVNFRENETINANFVNTAYSSSCVLTLNYYGDTVVNGTLFYGLANNTKPLNVNVNGTSVTFNNSATIGTLSASGKTVTLGTNGEGDTATQGNLTIKGDNSTVGNLRVEGGTITLASTPKKLSVQNSLYISKGSLLNANTVQAATSSAPTLEGEGTFLLNQKNLPSGFSLGETWTGSVLLKDVTLTDGYDNKYWMNTLSHEGSVLELSGFTGYDSTWAYGDNTANIRLTNTDSAVAWNFNASTSATGYAFDATGKWSGSGTFKASNTNKLDFSFAGDIAEWTGKFDYAGAAAHEAALTFKGDATEINAVITRTSGTLNLVVGEGNGDFAFNNTVNVNKVTVTEGQTASFGSLTTGTIALEDNAEMSIRRGGSLTYTKSAGAITLAAGSVLDVTALGAANDTRVLDLMRYASGEGTVKANATWAWFNQDSITTHTNFDITGNLYFGSNISAKATLTIGSGTTTKVSGDAHMEGGLTMAVAGTLNADRVVMGHSSSSTSAGHFVADGGSIITNSVAAGNAANDSTLTLRNGGSLQITGSEMFGSGSVENIALTVENGKLVADANNWTLNHDAAIGTATVDAVGHSMLTVSGVLSDMDGTHGTLTKTGMGTLVLTEANTYTGTTTVDSGALVASNSDALSHSVLSFSDKTAEESPYRIFAFATDLHFNNSTGALEDAGTQIDGTIKGLDGHRGYVVAKTLTIDVDGDETYEFMHRYDEHNETTDRVEMKVDKIVKTGTGTQVIGGDYSEARGFTTNGLVINNGVEVKEGTLHMMTRGIVTTNFDVAAGATLKTSDEAANSTTAAGAVQYNGKVTLHGDSAENAGTLFYNDGSTNTTNGLYVDGFGKVVNQYDKMQFINGLYNAEDTTSNDITFFRPQSEWSAVDDREALTVLTGSGDFAGTVHLSSTAYTTLNEKYGLQVLGTSAQNTLAGAVIDFSGDNASVLSFRNSDTASSTWTDSKMDGTVAGLTGTNGAVYANTLTVNTASADADYTFGGAMNVSGITKQGAGTQTLNGNLSSFTGVITTDGGKLVLNNADTAENATISANKLVMSGSSVLEVAEGTTLKFTGLGTHESSTAITSTFSNASSIIANGVVDFSAGNATQPQLDHLVKTTTGSGTLRLKTWGKGYADTVQLRLSGANLSLGVKNLEVVNSTMDINNWNAAGAVKTLTVGEEHSMTIDANMRLESCAGLVVEGDVTVKGTLTLGHPDATGVNRNATLTVNGGHLKVGSFALENDYDKAVNLESGTFELNNSAALTVSGAAAYNLNGGTLKASGSDVTINHAVNVGGEVTLEAANENTLAIQGDINVADDNLADAKINVSGTGAVYLNSDTVAVKRVEVKTRSLLELKQGTAVNLNELVLGNHGAVVTKGETSAAALLADADEPTPYSDAEVTAHVTVGGTDTTARLEASGTTMVSTDLTVAGNTQMVYADSVPQGDEGGINLNDHSLTLSAEGGKIYITSEMLETLNETRHLTLFSNVGGLTLGGAVFTDVMTQVSDTLYVTTANGFFYDAQRNPLGDQYTLAFDTVTKELYLAPEPTTAALSLLALGALAARRRRR